MSESTSILIRPATKADVTVLADFNMRIAKETENLALDPNVITAGVAAIFQKEERGAYFVAEVAGQVAGCLMITHEWSDWRNGDIWWIQSVYVHPDFRRRGVFSALYRHVEKAARAAGAVGIRLYMEEANKAAQATYERLGMKLGHYRVLEQMFHGKGD